jgi:hypothetical protein
MHRCEAAAHTDLSIVQTSPRVGLVYFLVAQRRRQCHWDQTEPQHHQPDRTTGLYDQVE